MNYRGDLERLAYVLGNSRPDVKRLLQGASLDPEMRETIAGFLRAKISKEGGAPDDPAAFPLVRELPPGEMRIGRVWNGEAYGPVFALSEGTRDDIQHVGIVGTTREGKSYLLRYMAQQHMEAGGRCWIIDPEDEHLSLVLVVPPPAKPISLCPHHLRINFFQPPCDSITTMTWLGDISLLLRQEMFLRDGSLNLFGARMIRLIKQKASTAGSGQYPSLAETFEDFSNLKLSGSKIRTGTWLESLLNRLKMLYDAFEVSAHVTSSDMLQQLAEQSVIFRLRSLRGIPLQYLVDFLIVWLTRYKEEHAE